MINTNNFTPLSQKLRNSLFDIKNLFLDSWTRLTSRLTFIIFAQIFSVVVSIVTVLLVVLVFLVSLYIINRAHIPLLILVFLPLWLVEIIGCIFIFYWTSLFTLKVITGSEKNSIIHEFKETKPLVWSYIKFNGMYTLFIIGTFFLFVLPGIFWVIIGSFSIFSFLYDQKDGLKPLWQSRELIKGKFWGTLLRLILLGLIMVSINMIENVFVGIIGGLKIDILKLIIQIIINLVNYFVLGAFSTVYLYEMYMALKQKTTGEMTVKGGIWPKLAIAGYLIFIALFIFLIIKR